MIIYSLKYFLIDQKYPASNVDERVIYVTISAGSFTLEEIEIIQAKAIGTSASMRDEISLEVIEELAQKKIILAVDVQSFMRINDIGKLVPKERLERNDVFACLDIFKN